MPKTGPRRCAPALWPQRPRAVGSPHSRARPFPCSQRWETCHQAGLAAPAGASALVMPRGDAGTLLSWSLFATFGTAGYEHQSRQWESSGQEGGSGAKQSEARSPTMAPALGWTWTGVWRWGWGPGDPRAQPAQLVTTARNEDAGVQVNQLPSSPESCISPNARALPVVTVPPSPAGSLPLQTVQGAGKAAVLPVRAPPMIVAQAGPWKTHPDWSPRAQPQLRSPQIGASAT